MRWKLTPQVKTAISKGAASEFLIGFLLTDRFAANLIKSKSLKGFLALCETRVPFTNSFRT